MVRAAFVGAPPLPLCTCGVIPAALGIRRSGASRSATISFLIATPENGVDSVTVVSPEVSNILTQSRPDENNLPKLNLTTREEEVLRLIADGLSNQEVGDRLGISVWTTKVHAKHSLKKLGLATRNELIVWAIREGISSDES